MREHEEGDLRSTRTRGPLPERVEHETAAPSPVDGSAGPASTTAQAVLELQRLAGNATVSRLLSPEEEGDRSSVLDVVGSGGGRPLEPGLRREMEGRLGADFGDVRVHDDSQASGSARSIAAQAYTVGSDVVFRSDRWSPDTDEGKRTLAHELAHVVQQRSGPVAGTPVGGGLSVSDPGDEFERAAERTADAAMASPAAGDQAAGDQAAARMLPAQRQDDEELEEYAQMLPAQRQDIPEEEELLQALPAQRQEDEEDEEIAMLLPAQRQDIPEEEELYA